MSLSYRLRWARTFPSSQPTKRMSTGAQVEGCRTTTPRSRVTTRKRTTIYQKHSSTDVEIPHNLRDGTLTSSLLPAHQNFSHLHTLIVRSTCRPCRATTLYPKLSFSISFFP